ncbi:MAG: glycosyltransferase, partial [Gammaproteobacteria bacterium]|nr:glycosyltransferase [Gammaproteobacteria bacterium]
NNMETRIKEMEASAARMKNNMETRIKEMEASAARMKTRLKDRDRKIDELYNSTSWKITAPMRVLARCIRWLLKNLRRALKLLYWLSTGQFSRALEAVRQVRAKAREKSAARRAVEQPAVTERVAKLARDRPEEQRPAVQAQSEAGKARTRVTVIAWDLGHNPLGRAYLLADVLRHDYDVELIGAQFPRFGNQVWEPLRNCSRVAIKSFPGAGFPEHFRHMEDIAAGIEGDVIYVSKPRLPGLELAVLAKLHRNRPVILDVDDYEPGFFKNREPLTLKQVKRKRHRPDFIHPQDETWTRYAETLIPLFDGITVSNEELRKKFGGMMLPHIRDEHDFDPSRYPREAIRAELGFAAQDKVIVFAGTPRIHKGFTRIVAALESLKRPDYKLLIVGSPVDNEAQRFIRSRSVYVKVVPNVPFSDLPAYLCAGDLICLLQAEDQVTSRFQMPAKLTDGLAMGIPALATNVPPLANLAEKGLVELLGDAPLEQKIDEIFSNYDAYKHKAVQNREIFVREYSYGANLPGLKDTIERVLDNPAPIPEEFRELVAYHRRIFSDGSGSSRVTARVVAAVQPAPVTRPSPPARAPALPAGKADSYVDDRMDIVFFWKQNDTGIYGRRQDMLVKYLAEDPRINRILHFDAPVNIFKSGGDVLKSGQGGRHSHAGLVLYETLRRIARPREQGKIRFDTFVFAGDGRSSRLRKWILPAKGDYLDYLGRVFKDHQIGRRRTIFWVCPNKFDFPMIADRFKPDLVVSDVIDDQRKWPGSPRYKEALHGNYEAILARSHLTFANCLSVFEAMQEFTDNVHLIPNACELLEEEARNWKKPAQLKRMKGPVIGYVGNLDITRMDLDLLARVAGERPDWNLVFIGSMHKSREIRKLDKFKNVHFLGVRVYEEALRYIRHFDVAMIPHLDNELTRNMNPLKLYVYFSLHVPVVSTPIANIGDFGEFVQVGNTPEEFIERTGHCLDNDPIAGNLERVRRLLQANSWNERTARILKLVGQEFARREAVQAVPAEGSYENDGYTDCCAVCGHTGYLRREGRSVRETYRCGNCGASLRYREQARLILSYFSRENSEHLAELARESEFQNLRIYEPGLIGPFRKLFHKLPRYCSSYYWEDVKPGEYREDVQCQDLMNLTYEDNSFDLVLSSDIFEHVRKPFVGFREVNRVLKPGGFHIFTVPTDHPLPAETVYRVDTSGPEDVFILPRHYHSAPNGGKSLVYTDFGEDMTGIMAADGIDLKMESPPSRSAPASITEQMLSFYWQKT